MEDLDAPHTVPILHQNFSFLGHVTMASMKQFIEVTVDDLQVYQCQMAKECLQKVIHQEQANDKMQDQGNSLSTEDLRDLFTLHEQVSARASCMLYELRANSVN